MNKILEIISSIHLAPQFTNPQLVEKSFKDWSVLYLKEHTVADYIDKIWAYFRAIESIDMEDIQQANKQKKMQRIFTLLDKLQLCCSREEQKMFGIEDLRMTHYHINPFMYGLMLMFYDIKDSKEIDKKITFISQWLEDIAHHVDIFYQKNKFKFKETE